MMAWITIDRFLTKWKFDLSNKIKQDFFQTEVVSILLNEWTLTKRTEKKLVGTYSRMLNAV